MSAESTTPHRTVRVTSRATICPWSIAGMPERSAKKSGSPKVITR